MKNFTNLVLLSTFIFGIISGNAAASLGGAASESGSSCYTKSETLSKLDTQGEKLVYVNEIKGEKDYVVDKNEQAKTEDDKNDQGSNGWKKSFKDLNSSKPAMFGLTVGVPVVAAGYGITINKLLKDNKKKRIKEEEKKRQKEEEIKIGEE